MPQAQSNGLTIEYETFGEPANPPLLLIMGLGTQMIAWPDSLCRTLANAGLYVVRFDNRDCGLSTKLDHLRAPSPAKMVIRHLLGMRSRAPYTLTDMAQDAAGLLDALQIPRAHVAGVSMGGMIAQHMAIEHPSRVSSLTSWMSTTGSSKLPSARWKVTRHMFLKRPPAPEPDAMREHLKRTLALIGSPGYPQDHSELIERALARSICPDGFRRQLAAIAASGCRRERLSGVCAPTLVIHGRDDPLIPLAAGEDTAAHVPGARLEIIDGLGHDIPEALVPRFAALLRGHVEYAAR